MTTTPERGRAIPDASHLYEVERRARHLERPGFRITELQLSPDQKPRVASRWHWHLLLPSLLHVPWTHVAALQAYDWHVAPV